MAKYQIKRYSNDGVILEDSMEIFSKFTQNDNQSIQNRLKYANIFIVFLSVFIVLIVFLIQYDLNHQIETPQFENRVCINSRCKMSQNYFQEYFELENEMIEKEKEMLKDEIISNEFEIENKIENDHQDNSDYHQVEIGENQDFITGVDLIQRNLSTPTCEELDDIEEISTNSSIDSQCMPHDIEMICSKHNVINVTTNSIPTLTQSTLDTIFTSWFEMIAPSLGWNTRPTHVMPTVLSAVLAWYKQIYAFI